MKYCSIYICWIIIVVIIDSLDSGVSNLLLSCCGINLSIDHCGMDLSLDHCGMNLSIDHNLGHYPSYNIFPTSMSASAHFLSGCTTETNTQTSILITW